MQQRGRKSGAALAVRGGDVEAIERPAAPLDLTPEQADVWVDIVNGLPADWFRRETWPLLVQYCRHTTAARRIAQLIDAANSRDEIDLGELKELHGMQARETAALKALAASMRLSQQATRSEAGAAGAKSRSLPTIKRPWESD